MTNSSKRPLTIAMFSDSYPPDINGVAVAVASMKKSLEAAGHKVYVVTPTEQTALTGKIAVDDDGVIRIPGIKINKLYGYRFARPVSVAAYKLLSSLSIDICHVHTEFSMRFLAAAFCNGKKLPIIYTYHTMYEDYTHYVTGGHADNVARRLVRWLVYLYAHGVSAVIAPTEKTKETLLGYKIKNEIFVVPTGVNTEKLKKTAASAAETARIKEKYGLQDKFVIVYLGRIAEEKNINMLISAMPEILEEIPEAVLAVVGYGPDEDNLKMLTAEKGLSDKVIFLGKAPHEKIGCYYAVGDVFSSASSSETQGLTYIEAMASGVPVIALKDTCLDGVLEYGRNGYTFTDTDGFCQRVKEFYSLSKEEKTEMAENAEKTAGRYSFETMEKTLEGIYYRFVESNEIIKSK